MAATDLITLAELRTALGIDPTDTRDDAKYGMYISYVSDVIRQFTERDFGTPNVTETRAYEYDGSGYLDIDDAATILSVELEYSPGQTSLLTPTDWIGKPARRDDSPVFTYLLLPGFVGVISPEMGFERNLDVYAREHAYIAPRKVNVTANWGWPTVPGDVKMAAIWTLQEWASRPSGEGLTSEAIEGWSRSWGVRTGPGAAAMAVPGRARDILASYSRVDV